MEALHAAVDYRRCRTPLRELLPETTARARAALTDLLDGERLAEFEVLARLVWETAVEARVPTLWCLRRIPPAIALLFVICRRADMPFDSLLLCYLTEPELLRALDIVPILADAPLQLCATSNPASFEAALDAARLQHGTVNAICDWPLSPAEVGAARRSRMRVIAPANGTGDPAAQPSGPREAW
jgi:hypothetical protein